VKLAKNESKTNQSVFTTHFNDTPQNISPH